MSNKTYKVRRVEKVVAEYVVRADSAESAILLAECGEYEGEVYTDMLEVVSSEAFLIDEQE